MVAPIHNKIFAKQQVGAVIPTQVESRRETPFMGVSLSPQSRSSSENPVGIIPGVTGTPVFASAQAGKKPGLLGANFQAIG